MTMFDVDTVNVEKKLQEIQDNDLYNFMKKQGYSEEQIKSAIRNTHLLDAINRLKEILCEPEEIVSILQKDGWKKEEIETAIKSQASQLPPVVMTGGIFTEKNRMKLYFEWRTAVEMAVVLYGILIVIITWLKVFEENGTQVGT